MDVTSILDKLKYIPDVGANDIIGWTLAFIGGVIVYRIVDGFQTRIARHTMISEIEDEINGMLGSELGLNQCKEDIEKNNTVFEKRFLRTLLDDEDNWQSSKDKSPFVYCSERFIEIRLKEDETKDFISTKAVHELMILFRRIEKLYKDRIIGKIDLVDMWRELIPFATSGRLDFFASYLSGKDIESIEYVVLLTAVSAVKYKNNVALDYFTKHFKRADIDEIVKGNSRIRLFDRLLIYKLRYIIKE